VRSYLRAAPGTAVPYRHRDPAYLSPEELAGLAARDARRALLERAPSPAGQNARRQSAITQFARLRARGLSVPRAAAAMGVAQSAGRAYERARKNRKGGTT